MRMGGRVLLLLQLVMRMVMVMMMQAARRRGRRWWRCLWSLEAGIIGGRIVAIAEHGGGDGCSSRSGYTRCVGRR